MTDIFFDIVNGTCKALAWFALITIWLGIIYWTSVFVGRYAWFLAGLPVH